MRRKSNYIRGFHERMEEACFNSGLSKLEITRRMGYERKALYESGGGWGVLKLARFCAVTGADANYLLGITGRSML